MAARGKSTFSLLAGTLMMLLLIVDIAPCVNASHHRLRRHVRSPVPTATPTSSLTPIVLITGGTGIISSPTGQTFAVLDTQEIFDPANGHFSAAAQMKTARDEPTATLLKDGSVLIVGGGASNAELFDPATNRF